MLLCQEICQVSSDAGTPGIYDKQINRYFYCLEKYGKVKTSMLSKYAKLQTSLIYLVSLMNIQGF